MVKTKSHVEALLSVHLKEKKIPFEREVKLSDKRKFRWDFVIGRLAIEIQGGIWMKKGAHNTGSAIQRDCEKSRVAVECGYIPVYFTSGDVEKGVALDWISQQVAMNPSMVDNILHEKV